MDFFYKIFYLLDCNSRFLTLGFVCILSITGYTQNQYQSSLNLMCWNVQLLPDFFSAFSKHLQKMQKERCPDICKYLYTSDVDLILLQEVFDNQLKRKIRDQLAVRYPYVVMPKSKIPFLKTSNGLMILSKYPVNLIDNIYFKKASGVDAQASKGVQLFSVEVNGLDWYIANTHLQAGDQEVRDHQYLQIKEEIIVPHVREHIPFLFGGDFNTSRGTISFSNMMSLIQLNNSDLVNERPYTSDEMNFWNNSGKSEIDYIFHKLPSGFEVQEYKIERPKANINHQLIDLSDHYPVFLNVEW